MSDQSTDELRLRATEAQMRRVLGLDSSSPARAQADHPISSSGNARRRHFVRDGEVPVTVIHHDGTSGTNKLEEVRHALREQIVGRERVERQLEEAHSAIQALETQLGHERIARDESLQRAEGRHHEVERQLEEECAARQRAEQDRDAAVVGRQEAERLLKVTTAQVGQEPSGSPERAKRSRKYANSAVADNTAEREPEVGDIVPAQDAGSVRKRRGRPPKTRYEETEFVEWWKPGWRDRFR